MKRIHQVFITAVFTAFLLIYEVQCNPKKTLKEKQTKLLVDGIDINRISDGDLNGLFNAEDEKLTGELDIWIGKQTLREMHRMKRIPPVVIVAGTRVAWTAGRYIMKSLIRNTLPRTIGKTRQYFKRGGYRSAMRDFWRFKPSDIKHFKGKNGQEGITGKILDGKYTLTVRKTSSYSRVKDGGKIIRQGRPTLELRSNTGGKLVRKVRYEDRWSYRHQKHNYKYKNTKLSGRRGRIWRSKFARTRSRSNYRRGRIRRSKSSRTRKRRRSRHGKIWRSKSSRTRSRRRSRRGGIRRSKSYRTWSRRKSRLGGNRSRRRSRRGKIRSRRRSRRSGIRSRRRSRRGGIRSRRGYRRGGIRSRSRYRRGGIRSRRRSRRGGIRSRRSRRGGIRSRRGFRRGRIPRRRRSRRDGIRSRRRSRRGRIWRSKSPRTRSRSRSRHGGIRRSRSSKRGRSRWG